jgi:hypothetical protein
MQLFGTASLVGLPATRVAAHWIRRGRLYAKGFGGVSELPRLLENESCNRWQEANSLGSFASRSPVSTVPVSTVPVSNGASLKRCQSQTVPSNDRQAASWGRLRLGRLGPGTVELDDCVRSWQRTRPTRDRCIARVVGIGCGYRMYSGSLPLLRSRLF